MDDDKKNFYTIEKSFHDNLAETVTKPLENIDIWEIENWHYIRDIIGNLKDKKILDVGCGFGRESILFAKKGAVVTGIDISDKTIKVAQRSAKKQGVTVDFKVLKVEDLNCTNKFDVVYCRATLHHFYDVQEVIRILQNCLNDNGIIIAQEPKAENPIAIIGRKFFNPSTETEHPFNTGELKEMFTDIYGTCNVKHFYLLSPSLFYIPEYPCNKVSSI